MVIVPLLMSVGISFTRWQGIGRPEWVGLDNYVRLFHDANFWASFRNIGLLIVAMAVIPTLIGLVLAAVLFDYVAKAFGNRTASALRSGFYLPQILPVAVTGIVWGWILHPDHGALNSILDALHLSGLARNWLGDPGTRSTASWRSWCGSRSAIRSSCSWPACNASIRSSTRRPTSTARPGGSGSRGSPCT